MFSNFAQSRRESLSPNFHSVEQKRGVNCALLQRCQDCAMDDIREIWVLIYCPYQFSLVCYKNVHNDNLNTIGVFKCGVFCLFGWFFCQNHDFSKFYVNRIFLFGFLFLVFCFVQTQTQGSWKPCNVFFSASVISPQKVWFSPQKSVVLM